MVVKEFEEFIQDGIAKKITPDKQRALHLYEEAERKEKLLQKTIHHLGITDENANDYVEYCYNIIMFLLRAHMMEKGYTSAGQGAHEAEVAFARLLHFSDNEIQQLDKLRYFRNGILYYGKRFDKEYAKIVIMFMKETYKKLKQNYIF